MSRIARSGLEPASRSTPEIAIALGAGGARGLAHLVALEALDDLGLKPALITGSSIGAIIGAAYAAGMPARALKAYSLALFKDRKPKATLHGKDVEIRGLQLREGDVLLIAPNKTHQFRADRGSEMRFLCLVPVSFDCGKATPGS